VLESVKNALLLVVLSAFVCAGAANAEGEQPLFRNDAVLKAVLTAPISQTYAQRHQDVRIYFPGQWTYVDEDGETRRLEVSIRTRGHFRREFCELPPLRLNFKKSEVKGTLFAGQNKLKLVAPCKEGDRYQQYVILEYLAYRTLEILTEHSYATRLVRLSYVDRDEKMDPWTAIGYLIEDDSDMADRLGLDMLKLETVKYDSLDQQKTAIVQMFQLMIANNDYSVLRPRGDDACCHNIDVLGDEESESGRIPIPFDFDMSGIVNAAYAAPPSQIPIRDVRVRYFYGLCQPRPILDEGIAYVQSKRDEIVALYTNSKELDKKTREKTLAYIDEFYDLVGSKERVDKQVIAHCRGQALMDKMLESTTD